MPNLGVNYKDCCREFDKLSGLTKHLQLLPPKYQKLVAEVVLLRVFSLVEQHIQSIACKLVCNTHYRDGAAPKLLCSGRSATDALGKMSTHLRNRPHKLSWTKASYIKENMKYVIDNTDHFIVTVEHNGILIDEMRRIRNRIAHNNQTSRRNYQTVVQRYYGAAVNAVTPGVFLLSNRTTPIPITKYLAESRVFFKRLVKA